MNENNYKEIGLNRIKEILEEGWSQIEFIEIVFREWAKFNQILLNKEYVKQAKVQRVEGDLDKFSLWLVDNIYLQVYCNGNDHKTVKEFCSKYFSFEDGIGAEN